MRNRCYTNKNKQNKQNKHTHMSRSIGTTKYTKTTKDGTIFTYTSTSMKLPHSFNDEPACIFADGTVEWAYQGKLSRDENLGPAYRTPSKFVAGKYDMEYWLDGAPHRGQGKPCLIYANGDKYYCEHGQQHRVDGPAVELASGNCEYWIEGKQVSKKEHFVIYNSQAALERLFPSSQIHQADIYAEELQELQEQQEAEHAYNNETQE